MAKKLRSPMTPFEGNPSHRTPSTAGTSEMKPDSKLKQSTAIRSPQTPFKIDPNAGRKK